MSSTTIKDASRAELGLELIGRTIGKYQVVRMIGRGGMGRVYEAINTSIQKRVALKLIDLELAKQDEVQARFQREALAASAVDSPYIVQIFDAGKAEGGAPYIVMELLRGTDLGHLIHARGRLEVPEVLDIAAQILKGLHHAHEAGIVHRDLKPDNVFLVDRDDEPVAVKLLDFGVSKIASSKDVPLQTLTRQGTVVGTPYYMSPEQAQAFPDVDRRTDIYSVGAILYECLTGRTPHRGSSYEQVIVNICMKDVEDVRVHNPAVPAPIADLIHQALSREREERFDSARAMLEALVEAAPDALRATPSSHLRISSGPRTPPPHTPQVISSPNSQPAHALADTVAGGEQEPELERSGISVKSAAAVTARAATGDAFATTQPSKRRWALMLAPGVALLAAFAWMVSFSSKGSEDAAAKAEEAPAIEAASAKPVAQAEPDEEEEMLAKEGSERGEADASETPGVEAKASATAVAAAPAPTSAKRAAPAAPVAGGLAHPARPPTATGSKPESKKAEKAVAAPPPEPTLELMPR